MKIFNSHLKLSKYASFMLTKTPQFIFGTKMNQAEPAL